MGTGRKKGPGGGGASLNFKVVGNPQPENPKENTIWVDTDTDITSWEFSSTCHSDSLELYAGTDITGYYVNSKGQDKENSNFSIAIIQIPEQVSELIVELSGNTASSTYHAFYDASGNLISTIQRQIGTNTIEIPNGATSIRMSIRSNDNPSVKTVPMIAEGMVWITTGNASQVAFNALKKNSIMVYPLSAKQYVNGAWVDVTAKSWNGSEWVDWWDGSIFDGNKQFGSITGGWENIPFPNTPLIVTSIDGGVRLTQNTSGGTGAYKTKQKVSLKGYNSLCFTGSMRRLYSNYDLGLRIYSEIGSKVTENVVAEYIPPAQSTDSVYDDTPIVDISGLDDSYYIAFYNVSNGDKYIDLKKLRLA